MARKVALNTAALVGGRVLSVLGGVATLAISSRYLSLGEYGAFVTAVALVGILEVLTDLGVYTMAAREIAQRPDEERPIVGNVLGLSLTVSAIVSLLGWALLQLLYSGPEHELVRKAGTLLIAALLVAPVSGAARAHFVASQRAFLSAAGEIASVAVTAVVMGLTVALDWGFTGIVAAYPAGRAFQALVVSLLVAPDVRFSFARDVRYWRRLLMVSLPLGAVMVINLLYFRLDLLLLSALRSAGDVALYGLAFKVVETLIVLPSYFMVTLFPELARMDSKSEQLRSVMGQALAIIEMLALPVLVLTAIFAEEIVTVVGGEKFQEATLALQLLALALALSFVNGVYGHALVALGRQSRLLRVSLAVLAANVAINLALIPQFGIYGAAAAVAVSELVGLAATRRVYRQTAPAPLNPLRWRMLLAAGALLVALAAKVSLPWDGVALMAAGSALGLACYAAALLALRAVPEAVRTQLLPALFGGRA